jgi:hypothetical protein
VGKPSGGSPDDLPIQERIIRYRQLAEEAFRKASLATDPERHSGYLSEAMAWHGLAAEIARNANRPLLGGEPNAKPRPPSKN